MDAEHLSYYERRAEEELELAQRALHPAAVRAHFQLADLYLDKVYGPADAGAPLNDRAASPVP